MKKAKHKKRNKKTPNIVKTFSLDFPFEADSVSYEANFDMTLGRSNHRLDAYGNLHVWEMQDGERVNGVTTYVTIVDASSLEPEALIEMIAFADDDSQAASTSTHFLIGQMYFPQIEREAFDSGILFNFEEITAGIDERGTNRKYPSAYAEKLTPTYLRAFAEGVMKAFKEAAPQLEDQTFFFAYSGCLEMTDLNSIVPGAGDFNSHFDGYTEMCKKVYDKLEAAGCAMLRQIDTMMPDENAFFGIYSSKALEDEDERARLKSLPAFGEFTESAKNGYREAMEIPDDVEIDFSDLKKLGGVPPEIAEENLDELFRMMEGMPKEKSWNAFRQ